MHKKLTVMLIGLGVCAAISGCGMTKEPGQGLPPVKVPAAAATDSGTVKPSADIKSTVKAYFGDEDGQKLVEQDVSVTYKQEQDKYAAALKALSAQPAGKAVALCQGIDVKSAVLAGNSLTVDLHMSQDAQLGASGEELVLQAIQKTLFQFKEIDSIELLVDGKKPDSLMGHLELPHPLKRS